MKSIKAFIKSYPVLSFFALTFAISWGGMLLSAMVVGGLGGSYGGIPLLAWFAGPPVAGILLTSILYGKAGLRDLLARMGRWRVGARWYAVALLTAPLLYVAVLLALSLSSPEFLPSIFTSNDKVSLVLFGIAYGLVGGGLLEELGWTGFAVPTLRRRYGVLGTGLIVGLAWGALHFLPVYWMSNPVGALALGLVLPAQLFAWLPAYRVLMVWVYDRTGESLLLAMLMHASLSASMLILVPLTLAGLPLLTYILLLAIALWVVVGAVAVANGGHLSRQPLQGRAA
jgi:uncharacterized protein